MKACLRVGVARRMRDTKQISSMPPTLSLGSNECNLATVGLEEAEQQGQ